MIASPPNENHVIEIVCNRGGINGNENLEKLSTVDILNKLKQIHEKLKRLNSTYLDPKLGKLSNNKTQMFIDKNTRKLLNMTSSLGLFGKKQSSSKSSTPSSAVKDLETEIEKFFSTSSDQLTKELDTVDAKSEKKKLADSRLIDLLAIAKSKITSSSKKSKDNKSGSTSKSNDEEEENRLDNNDNEHVAVDETKTEELFQQLEQLSQDLDMGEKILKKVDPGRLNVSKISDTLAELMPAGYSHQGQAEHLNANGESILYANAQRQDISRPQSSSSTGMSNLRLNTQLKYSWR